MTTNKEAQQSASRMCSSESLAEVCWLQNKFSIQELLSFNEDNSNNLSSSQHVTRNHTNQIEIKNLIAPIALFTFVLFILSSQQVIEASNSFREDDLIIPSSSSSQKQAQFAEPESSDNIHRIPVGRSVKFKCVVNNLGAHRVAWFHKDKRVLLALDNKTIVWKDRIHASSQGDSVFFLQIDNVQLADKGHYICQLNTQPVQSQVHILEVSKPPQIKEQETTINIEPVKEFNSVELRCVAEGIPKPSIKWRRESQSHLILPLEDENEDVNEISDGQEQGAGDKNSKTLSPQMALAARQGNNNQAGSSSTDLAVDSAAVAQKSANEATQSSPTTTDDNSGKQDIARLGVLKFQNSNRSAQTSLATTTTTTTTTTLSNVGGANNSSDPSKLFIGEGEILHFDRATRYDMGFYICIASNGVPPSVSQRIFLPVSFIPKLRASTSASNGRSGKTLDGITTNTSSNLSSANGVNLSHTSTWPTGGSGRSLNNIGRAHRKHHSRIVSSTSSTLSSSSSSSSSAAAAASAAIINTQQPMNCKLMMAIVSILMYYLLLLCQR